MPEGARYVGRPTMFGNPYQVNVFGVDVALRLFRNTAQGCWVPNDVPDHLSTTAYRMHCEWLKRLGRWGARHPIESLRVNLEAWDLACWCPLDQPCHADVLLELANAPAAVGSGRRKRHGPTTRDPQSSSSSEVGPQDDQP